MQVQITRNFKHRISSWFQVSNCKLVVLNQSKYLKHTGPNAYIVDFHTDYKNDSIFNSENLAIYKGLAVYYQPHNFVQIPIPARK